MSDEIFEPKNDLEHKLVAAANPPAPLPLSANVACVGSRLPDQRTDAGELVTFFGCAGPTTIGPEWLALSRGCPLVPVQVERLGVRLTDSLLMIPSKSVSGIRFPTEQTFASCQLCPRAGCPSRQAPYDATLYDKKYRVQQAESPLPGATQEEETP